MHFFSHVIVVKDDVIGPLLAKISHLFSLFIGQVCITQVQSSVLDGSHIIKTPVLDE